MLCVCCHLPLPPNESACYRNLHENCWVESLVKAGVLRADTETSDLNQSKHVIKVDRGMRKWLQIGKHRLGTGRVNQYAN